MVRKEKAIQFMTELLGNSLKILYLYLCQEGTVDPKGLLWETEHPKEILSTIICMQRPKWYHMSNTTTLSLFEWSVRSLPFSWIYYANQFWLIVLGAFRGTRQLVGRDSKRKLPWSVLEGILAPSGPYLTVRTQALHPYATTILQQQLCSQSGSDSSEPVWVSWILHCSQLLIPRPP